MELIKLHVEFIIHIWLDPPVLERMHLHQCVLEEEYVLILINALVNQNIMEMSANSCIAFKSVLEIILCVLGMEIAAPPIFVIVDMDMLEKTVKCLFAMELHQI
jgi:hypothetical protein